MYYSRDIICPNPENGSMNQHIVGDEIDIISTVLNSNVTELFQILICNIILFILGVY